MVWLTDGDTVALDERQNVATFSAVFVAQPLTEADSERVDVAASVNVGTALVDGDGEKVGRGSEPKNVPLDRDIALSAFERWSVVQRSIPLKRAHAPMPSLLRKDRYTAASTGGGASSGAGTRQPREGPTRIEDEGHDEHAYEPKKEYREVEVVHVAKKSDPPTGKINDDADIKNNLMTI